LHGKAFFAGDVAGFEPFRDSLVSAFFQYPDASSAINFAYNCVSGASNIDACLCCTKYGMVDKEAIMEIARGIDVPLRADSIERPEVRYRVGANSATSMTCIVFTIADETNCVGRVTFEGFDSIRCCRGEYMPYKIDRVDKDHSEYPWVFEVDNSSWLKQRHEYENGHYKTPLLEEYIHYLFSFHDEFVELIAQGIWFEKVRHEQVNAAPSAEHPLMGLPESLPSEDFVIDGIHCLVRRNPLPPKEMIERSQLCSQILFQYFLTLDGQTKPSYAAKLRTIRGKPMTRLRGALFFKDLFAVEGIGQEAQVRKAFEQWVREVAERRRRMGKSY
jgi:hypothetical protein